MKCLGQESKQSPQATDKWLFTKEKRQSLHHAKRCPNLPPHAARGACPPLALHALAAERATTLHPTSLSLARARIFSHEGNFQHPKCSADRTSTSACAYLGTCHHVTNHETTWRLHARKNSFQPQVRSVRHTQEAHEEEHVLTTVEVTSGRQSHELVSARQADPGTPNEDEGVDGGPLTRPPNGYVESKDGLQVVDAIAVAALDTDTRDVDGCAAPGDRAGDGYTAPGVLERGTRVNIT